MQSREQMNIVIVGHVDHGKSTVIGRLLADTDALPKGKLEQIKTYCKNNSKDFEYAFLLDALKDEQSQGITIDSARCFFKSKKRDYIIIDAPGHIEFLKNMISGAARAEAAVLVIDAEEGIRENSRRHGYMLSMLGIKQVIVCVNKMDLVNYDKKVFDNIQEEYTKFLRKINIEPKDFVAVSAKKGDNIAEPSEKMNWFGNKTILTSLDSFEKEKSEKDKGFRMPVQDIYRFSKKGDNRRIIAGRVESGSLKIGDEVIFLPSFKKSKVKTIEEFNPKEGKKSISAGESTGVTLEEEIYIKRGEIMCKQNEKIPKVSSLIKASIFWMGKKPLELNKEYKLKIMTANRKIKIKEIVSTLDASNLSVKKKDKIERHEVAECIIECFSPIAADLYEEFKSTGRFVIIDDYEISGGGIISEVLEDDESKIIEEKRSREVKWEKSFISREEKSKKYNQTPKIILITGKTGIDKKNIAKKLEERLFNENKKVYFLGIGNVLRGLDADIKKGERDEHIRRLSEVANILLDAGLIIIITASDLSSEDLKNIKIINNPENVLVININSEKNKTNSDLDLIDSEESKLKLKKIMNLLNKEGVLNFENE